MTIETKCQLCDAVMLAEAPSGQCVRCALNLLLEPAPDEPVARTVGPYVLLEQIGEGGMGAVWKARHQRLNRLVALKLLKSGFLASPRELERFRFEMEAVASFDHPHIVPVFDASEDQGQVYYAMRLLEGGSLADRMEAGKVGGPGSDPAGSTQASATGPAHDRGMDPHQAARLVATMARAIHHAHQCGILHRDLKPSNILLDADGKPHIADFGLAKRLGADPEHTVTGAILGSIHYLSPEQVARDSNYLTTAVDVYALGVILYELLAGRPPFTGSSIPAILRQIVEDDPVPPLSRSPASGRKSDSEGAAPRSSSFRLWPGSGSRRADLNIVCLKCLAKDPVRRYASAAALADDLDRWRRHEPILARPPGRWERAVHAVRCHPVRAGLAGLALLALMLGLTFAYVSQRTYFWLMGKIADEHLISAPGPDGTFLLYLTDDSGARCTYNFWKVPFGSYYNRTVDGRYARLKFDAIPAEVADTMRVRVWSDVPGYPDVARTRVLTNHAVFFLNMGQRRERAFYFTEENFAASNILARYSNAALRVVLLGYAGDPDPLRPAGKLRPWERP